MKTKMVEKSIHIPNGVLYGDEEQKKVDPFRVRFDLHFWGFVFQWTILF